MTAECTLQGKHAVHATWQLIATGGWWKPREVAEALGMALPTVHSRLTGMASCGYLARRRISPELRVRHKARGRLECVEYAVNGDSIVPQGMTAKTVLDAINGPSE